MAIRPGTVIAGRFEVERLAGRGSMGEVYRARDRSNRALVAVKVLQASTEALGRRFARETRLLSELSHPGIVRYVDGGRGADGVAYLAMEWLDGEDLAMRL